MKVAFPERLHDAEKTAEDSDSFQAVDRIGISGNNQDVVDECRVLDLTGAMGFCKAAGIDIRCCGSGECAGF
ncbi:MAG: hypothetical protein MI861_26450, partial [Pirellulales bacterium]|nr:hypothetical protein [Pirellulales bacterium]